MPHTRHALFLRLIRPFIPSLYNTALRMTCDEDTAVNLLQETFYQAGTGLQVAANKRIYLFKILFENLHDFFKYTMTSIEDFPETDVFYLYKRLDENIGLQEISKEKLIENL